MVDGTDISQLSTEQLLEFQKGVNEFNCGMFFECHETLEDLWHGICGPSRDFYQGLIQIAVGFYHLGNGNRTGGQSQLEKGLRRLERYGDSFLGIELEQFRAQVAEWLAKARTGSELGGHVRDLPKIRFITSRSQAARSAKGAARRGRWC
jgi:predicted metal-dependent hydrolase